MARWPSLARISCLFDGEPAKFVRVQVVTQRLRVAGERLDEMHGHVCAAIHGGHQRTIGGMLANGEPGKALELGGSFELETLFRSHDRIPRDRLKLWLSMERAVNELTKGFALDPTFYPIQGGDRLQHFHRAKDADVELLDLLMRNGCDALALLAMFPASQRQEEHE